VGDYRQQVRDDVEATLLAHRDDGHGQCAAGCVDMLDLPAAYPCQVRLWHEHAAYLIERRQRAGGRADRGGSGDPAGPDEGRRLPAVRDVVAAAPSRPRPVTRWG
jgi:hypothetical protein